MFGFILCVSIQRAVLAGDADTARKAPDGSTLVATSSGQAEPESIMDAGGDWPQWGGTYLRNNVPSASDDCSYCVP